MRSAKPRVYRDPVHDIISYKEEPTLGPVVCALIDAPEFQRLRSVRQLGLASLVFHGAEHSRFAHSMGVALIARRMCDRLPGIDADTRLAVVCAALLHDIGHAPFSHVMERVFSFHHEDTSAAIVRDPESQVHRVLRDVDPVLPERVAGLLSGKEGGFAAHIVSSQLDADRADYLLRDALMTGVGVGRYDLERILLTLGHDADGLFVDIGGYESVEGYLVARYHMYRLVYFHRAVRAAEAMVERAFARARHLIEHGDDAVAGGGPLGKLMRRQPLSSAEHSRMGDFAAWSLIDAWRDHTDPILSTLATGIMERRLFRAVERTPGPNGDWSEDDARREELMDRLAANERWFFFVDDAGDVPYRPYVPGDTARRALRIRDHDGRIFHIEERSHLARALGEATYRLRRWTFHPMLLPRLKDLIGP
jgi:putative nucleotidyltransferase with HDIG domain